MGPLEVIEVAREGLTVMLKIGAPVMMIALVVGLTVSLVQALTQIQEMTLAFVPKILVIFLSIMMLLPFMMHTLVTFAETLFDRIVSLG